MHLTLDRAAPASTPGQEAATQLVDATRLDGQHGQQPTAVGTVAPPPPTVAEHRTVILGLPEVGASARRLRRDDRQCHTLKHQTI